METKEMALILNGIRTSIEHLSQSIEPLGALVAKQCESVPVAMTSSERRRALSADLRHRIARINSLVEGGGMTSPNLYKVYDTQLVAALVGQYTDLQDILSACVIPLLEQTGEDKK